MRLSLAAVGAAALLASPVAPAGAAVYFDTLNGVIPSDYDGHVNGASVIAQSFSAANPDFTSISLSLSSDSQNANGAVTIYLAPDDGSGNAAGVAGAPVGVPLGAVGGSSINTSSYLTLGTVADSSLPKTSVANNNAGPGNGAGTALTTFTINPASLPATQDREYWVIAVGSANSDFEWFLKKPSAQSADVTSVGITNQDNGNDIGGWGTYDIPTGFVYGMAVTSPASPTNAPEPATILVLATGLAGLGILRRRAGAL